MLAVVKKPRTKKSLFEIKGEIPQQIIDYLKEKYTVVMKEDEEELINIMETDWYREMKDRRKPGDAVRVYRDNFGYTQAELGKMLGGLSRQKVSDLENNRRGISKDIALKLAKLFRVPVERFLK